MVQVSFFNFIILLLRHSQIWRVGALQNQLPCSCDIFFPQHFLLSDITRYSWSTCTYPAPVLEINNFSKEPCFLLAGNGSRDQDLGDNVCSVLLWAEGSLFLGSFNQRQKIYHIHACKCSFRQKHLKIKIHRHAHIHVFNFIQLCWVFAAHKIFSLCHGMPDFQLQHVGSSSLTRGQTSLPSIGSLQFQPLDHQRSLHIFFKISSVHTDAYNSNSCLEFFLSLLYFIFVWPFATERILVSNKILCIHLLNPMTHLKQFQNFASTTINKTIKKS